MGNHPSRGMDTGISENLMKPGLELLVLGILFTVYGACHFWNIGNFARRQYESARRQMGVIPRLGKRWEATTSFETYRKRAVLLLALGPVLAGAGVYSLVTR
jgi:hypothetical protein